MNEEQLRQMLKQEIEQALKPHYDLFYQIFSKINLHIHLDPTPEADGVHQLTELLEAQNKLLEGHLMRKLIRYHSEDSDK